MGPVDIFIVVAAVAIVVGVVVWRIVRKKQGKGGCDCGCSDCSHCTGACASAKKPSADKKG